LKPIVQADTPREQEIQKKRLRDNCREFESVMVSYLLKTMRDGVIRAEEPDNAQAMYEEMLDGQISKNLAQTTALGIGDMLYSKLEPLVKTQTTKGTADGESGSGITVQPARPDVDGIDVASQASGTETLR
jgi:Rod binding domain-containing protein